MKGKLKTKKGRLWGKIIKGAVNMLKSVIVSVIPDPVAAELWMLSLKPTDDIVDALTNDNPNNKEEILHIIQQYTNADVIPFGEVKYIELTERIVNPNLQAITRTLGQIPFVIGKIYTDDNPNNEAQLLAYLEKWVEDGGNQADVARVVGMWIEMMFKNNPAIAMFINQTIQARIEDGDLLNVDWDGDGV